jgi:hypothetical protein
MYCVCDIRIGGGNVINGDMDYCTDDDKPAMRPSTPPSRLEAFEVFKKGRGREINKIFLQNKGNDDTCMKQRSL